MPEASSPQPGDRLYVTIEEVHPAEVKVRLPDDSQGRIARKELTWDRRVRRPDTLVKVGDRVEAIVLPRDRPFSLWELSLRQAQGEPWEQAAKCFRSGSVVKGRVVSILYDRAYVQVLPGVDGLVPVHEIPLKNGQTIKDALWIGDRVVAIITYFSCSGRQMHLSIRKYVDRVEQIKAKIRDRDQARKQVTQELAAENTLSEDGEAFVAGAVGEEWISPDGGHPIVRILIVDDDPEFYSLFSSELQRMGYEVEVAEILQEGYEKATSSDLVVDMAFLDLDLVEGDGLELASRILQTRPSLPVVIITAMGQSERQIDLDRLGIVDLLVKPPDYQVIQCLLKDVAEGRWVRRKPIRRFTQRPTVFAQRTSTLAPAWNSWEKTAQDIIDELRTTTGASCVILFYMDPLTDQAAIEAYAGTMELDPDYDWNQARYSPIQDVIQSGEQVFERDAQYSKSTGQFRNLLSLLSFSSCIGVPVPALQSESRYGLFLFHIVPRFFREQHVTLATVAAHSLALAAERQNFAAQLQTFQQFLVTGQIGAGLMHDLSNQLMGLEQCFKNLELTVGTLSPSAVLTLNDWEDLRSDVTDLGRLNEELSRITRFYLEIIQEREEKPVAVNEVLGELAARLHREARAKQVELVLELDPDLPKVLAARGRLQQAFLNIMLNAIQHIGLHNSQGGVLAIRSTWDKSADSLPIRITFSDDGPGIHRQLFERIFERGVSTRRGGSGLGLYIARSLIGSIGGQIRVEDSTLFVGSSFLVELPATVAEGELS